MPESPRVTVVILTFNGETYLKRILSSVFEQRLEGEIEVLVIDSGSTDDTLAIVAEFPTVRLHQIPNAEFGHGKTRNLAARLAAGEFLAFLTHDAIPVDEDWLDQLLLPFGLDDKVMAVLGRQIPRAACFPLQKYDIAGLFAGLGNNAGTTLYFADGSISGQASLDVLGFYSDVNSATRRAFLTEVLPYRDVPYAEDQLFGKDVIEAGYIKAYSPRAAVEHSNDLTYAEFGKRIFDETVGLRRIGFDIRPLSGGSALRMGVRGAIADTLRIVRDPHYTTKRKLFWLVVNPLFHAQKWRNYRRSTIVDLADSDAIEAGSLEHSRKRK